MQQQFPITQIFGGVSPTARFGPEGSYLAGVAIDPDFSLTDSGTGSIRTAGVIRPVAYAAFQGANVNANPYWLITNPKNSNVYVYLNNGRFISYNSSLASETLVATALTSSGNGMIYYNNYIYLFRNTDIDIYGPLDGTPSVTTGAWTGTALGSQTALKNTTYPSIRGSGVYPNHPAYVHRDGKLYFADYNTTNFPGQGVIHFIATKKTTNEGDTNNGSTYEALDLPFGYMPIAITGHGNDLVIAAVQTSNGTLNQGKAALFFWDTVSSSFYRQVDLPDPLVTALLCNNGLLYVWGGKNTATGGYSCYLYLGEESFKEIATFEEGHSPLAGAVDANGDRIVWGSWITYPTNAAVVWAYGSKDGRMGAALHCIARATASATSTDGVVTCLKFATQSDNTRPAMVIGWRDASNFGLDKLSTTYQTSIWRSPVFNIGRPFQIQKIRLPLGQAVAANMTITPTLYFDDESSSRAGTTINNTNYANSERNIVQYSSNFVDTTRGSNNFYLELQFSGTALVTVVLPIEITVDILTD